MFNKTKNTYIPNTYIRYHNLNTILKLKTTNAVLRNKNIVHLGYY